MCPRSSRCLTSGLLGRRAGSPAVAKATAGLPGGLSLLLCQCWFFFFPPFFSFVDVCSFPLIPLRISSVSRSCKELAFSGLVWGAGINRSIALGLPLFLFLPRGFPVLVWSGLFSCCSVRYDLLIPLCRQLSPSAFVFVLGPPPSPCPELDSSCQTPPCISRSLRLVRLGCYWFWGVSLFSRYAAPGGKMFKKGLRWVPHASYSGN